MEKTVSTATKYTLIGNYRYEQDKLLGSGFESQVYKAQHRLKKHEVALKVVDVQKLGQGINRKLFQSQLRCLEELKSTPHVLNLHQVIRTQEKIYVVTQLCFGDLNSRTQKMLPRDSAWAYLQQAIKGYRYLYDKGIVHRDLKPGNLFLNMKNQVKIGDFGFAGKLSEVRKQSYYNIGSPGYMAPETVHRNEYSYASDIWSIGIIYYELLTGRLPWTAKSEENITKQMNETYLKRALIQPEIDQNSKKFLLRLLCFNEFDRMKPEELFEYQLDQDSGQSREQLQISLNGKKLPKFDELSKTTAENSLNTKKEVSKNKIKNIHHYFGQFSPPKVQQPTNINIVPLNSTKNQTLNSMKNQPKTGRRNSFQLQLQGNKWLQTNTPRTSCFPVKDQSFKKKRKNSEMYETFGKIHQQQTKQAKIHNFNLQNLVLAQISLLERLFTFFKHIDSIGQNIRWDSQLHLMKVCLKNVMVNIIMNNNKGEQYYKTIAEQRQAKRYVNSQIYEKHQQIFKKYQKDFKADSQLEKQWTKARQQNIDGAINVVLAFLTVIKPCLMDSRKYGLQTAFASCQIIQKLSSIQHPEKLKSSEYYSNESIFTNPKVLKRIEAYQKIQQTMQLKPIF